MNRNRFDSQENLEADDLNIMNDDIETLMSDHLLDFHASNSLNKVLNGLNITATSPEGLQVQISTGLAYGNYKRAYLPANTLVAPTTVPSGGGATDIRRIDLIYIVFNRAYSNAKVRRFIDINGNITEQTIFTRLLDSYSLTYVEGTESSSPIAPTAPTGAVSLANIYLRKNTNAIFSVDTGSPLQGYFVDIANR